jgi:hypothetical protein
MPPPTLKEAGWEGGEKKVPAEENKVIFRRYIEEAHNYLTPHIL